MSSEIRPFFIDFDAQTLRDFLRNYPLLDDEIIVLESYAQFARENDVTVFNITRVTDFLLARGQSENLLKLKTLANVRRLITQTAYSLRDKHFIEFDSEGGEIQRIRLTDPMRILLNDYYQQMQSNLALAFPDEEMLRKFLIAGNYVEISVQEIAGGGNHRLHEEKQLIVLRFTEPLPAVCVIAEAVDILLDICLLKLKGIIVASAQNRLAEDLVKDMQSIMPQKTSNVERIMRILSHSESEEPLYFLNLANRLAAYFNIDKDKKGMVTLIQAARLVETFKGYEAWLESEKNNQDKIRENAIKLLNIMAEYPALLNRSDIVQKVVKGSSGLEMMASILNQNEIEVVVKQMLEEFTVFQADERELLPALLKFKLDAEEFFIHREALLIFFESERKRVRAELLARFRKMWYALMLKNESRSAMEFDEFFSEDVEKFVKNHEPIFSMLLQNPQAVINAFHIVSRHPVSTNLQELYFFIGNRVIFKPLHVLLELNRKTIHAQVRAELPFLYRYSLLRWLATLFGLVQESRAPAHNEKTEIASVASGVNRDTDWHRALTMVETRLIGEKNAQEMILKYGEQWNNKLGDLHKQLTERVNTEVQNKAKRLYSMTRKLPEITQSFLANEIANAATQSVRKFGNDAADSRALNQYIQLSLIETLKGI